jgi:hypothetical protein
MADGRQFINITLQFLCVKKLFLVLSILCGVHAISQIPFSIATDASVMRNFSPQQKFWAFGQTIQGNFHFTKKETGYIWVAYFSPGKFKNTYTATAKSPATNPSSFDYTVAGTWRPRQVSLGWKHYFKGSFDAEESWSLYGLAGFGLMVSKIENVFSVIVDTATYNIPAAPANGNGSFRRLTFDLGLGVEFPIGADLYVYGDVRTWVPTTDNTSAYFHNTKNVPAPVMINGGVRILLDWSTY